ncbi:MAG: hypothetical protein ACQEVA_05875 [Myxococcota bacterium]
MSNRIDNFRSGTTGAANKADPGERGGEEKPFGTFIKNAADGALKGIAAVAPILPGGQVVKMAADGLRGFTDGAPDQLGGANGEQMDKMWEMQEENQMFNLQYLQLQEELQADNRHFSTMSNLMKARHDTAKSAINNMHV